METSPSWRPAASLTRAGGGLIEDLRVISAFTLSLPPSRHLSPPPGPRTGRYAGICLINSSDKSDSCSRAYVDERRSAAPSLYICQSQSRARRVKGDKLEAKRSHSPSPDPPRSLHPSIPFRCSAGPSSACWLIPFSLPL